MILAVFPDRWPVCSRMIETLYDYKLDCEYITSFDLRFFVFREYAVNEIPDLRKTERMGFY